MQGGTHYQDRGWGPALKTFVGAHKGADGVTLLRVLFISLTTAALLILFVLTFIEDDIGSPPTLLLLGVVALSALGAIVARRISRSGLDPNSPAKSLELYRTRFFLAFVLNEAPLLIAFVLCFVEDALWPYLVALAIYLVGMAGIAPGRRNFDAIEADLMRRGATFSLRAELSRATPSSS